MYVRNVALTNWDVKLIFLNHEYVTLKLSFILVKNPMST